MQLFKAKITPVASFCSRLQSDTLFGAFCWSYKYIFGEEKLQELIQQCMDHQPPIIFSNAFPENSFPLPLGVKNFQKDVVETKTKDMGKQIYQDNKKYKKAQYITLEAFQTVASGMKDKEETMRTPDEIIVKEPSLENSTVRNMVSRASGTVQNIDDAGNLYSQTEYSCKENECYDIYILTSIDQEQLTQVLQLMFLLGIGKKKSTGKGQFTLNSLEKYDGFEQVKQANAYVLLSNYIPAHTDSTRGNYTTYVKFPMLDREFATSGNPHKKPLIFINSGAVFFANENKIKDFYGRCVTNVAETNDTNRIIVSGFSIAVPIQIKED